MESALLPNKTSSLRLKKHPTLVTSLVLLLTMLVRVLWLHTFPVQATATVDAEGYFLLGRNILNGDGFTIGWDPPFCANTVRTPAYPLFIALIFLVFGESTQVVVLFHVLLEVLTTAITIQLSCSLLRLVNSHRRSCFFMGMLSGILYAVNGTTQRYTGLFYSETLLLPLLAFATLLSCRVLQHPSILGMASAGIFWALSILTKPNVQYLACGIGLILTIAILRKEKLFRSRLLSIITFWLTLLLCLSPWLLRNKILTSRWLVSTAFEENLARVSAVAVMAEIQGVPAEPWTTTWEHIYDLMELHASIKYGGFFSVASPFNCQVITNRHNQVVREATRLLTQHPLLTIRTHMRGVIRSILDPGHRQWYATLTGKDWSTTEVVPNIWQRMAWSLQQRAVGDAIQAFISQRITQIPPLAGLLWWGLTVGKIFLWYLVIQGLWLLRRNQPQILLLAGLVLYILILPGPIAHDRFYIPAIPVVISLAVLGIKVHINHTFSYVE
jgi:hypothetical protein